MKKIITILLIAALIFGAVVLMKKRKKSIAETPTASTPAYMVRTVTAQPRDIRESSSFLAQLAAVNRAAISSKLSGRISEILVSESVKVQQGDLLIRIDDTEIVTAINGLKAQLSAAVKQKAYTAAQYERNLALFNAGGLAKEKLDASEVSRSTASAAVEDLQQKLKGLENQLDYLNIRAPFDGIVGTVFLRRGDLAAPGKPILSLNSLTQKLTFSFMPGKAAIAVGQQVLLNNTPVARVSTLYNDARNGLTVAEIALEQRMEELPSGSFLTIQVITKTASGCSVPIQALLHRPEGESIMLYQGDRFHENGVTVSARDNDFALIDPCFTQPVAVASEAKLSLLPSHGRVSIFSGKNDE